MPTPNMGGLPDPKCAPQNQAYVAHSNAAPRRLRNDADEAAGDKFKRLSMPLPVHPQWMWFVGSAHRRDRMLGPPGTKASSAGA